MKSWRLNWIIKEAFKLSDYSKHKKVLKTPAKFYMAVAAKAVPGLWKRPLSLALKKGGRFLVTDFMTLYIYKEIFIDGCYDYPTLHAEATIVDIGANTGLFSIRMKQLYPQSTLYCFEPFPTNFQQLQKNITMSGFQGVNIFQQGVGGHTRKEKLFIHKTNVGGHSIFQAETGGTSFVHIEIVSLKEVFKTQGVTKCSLLKLDCEGAEYEIIKSIDGELASSIDRILFEPTRGIYDVGELEEHLAKLGYKVVDKGLCYAYKD